MLRGRKKRNDGTGEMAGQDSFLDIVSNIVGILIILIMIAGVRAQNSVIVELPQPPQEIEKVIEPELTSEPKPEPEPEKEAEPEYADIDKLKEIEEKLTEYKKKEEIALKLREEIEQIQEQTEVLDEQIQIQAMQHAEFFDLMTSARAALEMVAEEKDQATKEKIEYQRQIIELEKKLEELGKTQHWLNANRPKATVMENIPTPISKTVDEKEAQFRLLGGRIAYVPILELSEKMKLEVAANKNRYFKQKNSTGVIGPIDDFQLEFMMVTYDVPMRDAYGSGIGTRLELEYAEFVPVREPLGQSLKEALATPDSALMQKLRRFRQDIYTITVWVYPDSFEEYRELKQFLYSKGYRVAARPMEFGEPISGSPRGSKSSAQ